MELKDIKKLSPEERIERLREIAKKDKKEIEDAQELIKESEVEIEEDRKEKEQIPIPQLRAANISELTGQQEKQMFRAKRYEREETERSGEREEEPTPLEETIEREEVTEEARKEAEKGQYFHNLSTEQLTQKAEDLYMQAKDENFYLTREQKDEEKDIYSELKRREEENISEEVAEEIHTGRRILKSLYQR